MSPTVLAAGWQMLRRFLLVALGALAVLGLLAWIFQRKLIYFPDGGPVPKPAGEAGRDLREVEVETADGVRLLAWYKPGRRNATVLLFHGNAGHRGHRLGLVQAFHRLGYGVFVPDYRGYGGSGGSPTEEGLYLDAEACRAWLLANAPGPLVYMGNSIGGGVAVELARRHPPAALMLQSPFTSLPAVGQRAYPFLPVRWLLKDRYENLEKIGALRCPLLVLHGDVDTIVPFDLGRTLFEAAPEPKRWVTIDGAGHNDIVEVGGAQYWDAIDGFLGEHVAS